MFKFTMMSAALLASSFTAALELEANRRKPPIYIALDYYGEDSDHYDAEKLEQLMGTLKCLR